LATLSPRGLELTGELADGWLGACLTPERPEAHLEHLDRGLAKAGRSRDDLTLSAGGTIAFVDDADPLIQRAKPGMAFMLGAMGSPTTNFYNDAYKRGGFEDVAIRVQELWIEGRRDEAIGAVPDEMIREVSLIGDEAHVRAQLRKYVAAGIDVFRISPHGANATERLDTLGRAVELIQQETA
jgi:alkanesulfonate monooxygenase SsuD/methylene tetrahydromethanopterin reductase-like flavin-dependent oxidoreductase (luciferase family)